MTLLCSNPDCKLAEDGKCVRGYALDECPDADETDDSQESNSSLETFQETVPAPQRTLTYKQLRTGAPLEPYEANLVTRSSNTRVIAILGEKDSGKTTLVASINDGFQIGCFAHLRFAGSLTLPAFEQRCHLARAECGLENPDTERTKLGLDTGFLHLSVQDIKGSDTKELLLSDISGERCKLARHSVEDAAALTVLLRANHVALLIDGAKLLDVTTRQKAKTQAEALIRSLSQASVLRPNAYLDIVISKWDLLADRDHAFVDTLYSGIVSKHSKSVARLRLRKISARQQENQYDLHSLLRDWVFDTNVSPLATSSGPIVKRSSREYLNFGHVEL